MFPSQSSGEQVPLAAALALSFKAIPSQNQPVTLTLATPTSRPQHFKCEICLKKLTTAKALAVHSLQVHKVPVHK